MSRHRISRTDFWNVVLDSIPFAHLSGALHRAGYVTGASAALRSRMITEVLSEDRKLPPEDRKLPHRPDHSHEVLLRCLRFYRAKRQPPNAPSGNERLIVLKDKKAKAFWKALTRARGLASLLWNGRATAIDPTRPSTFRALAMPAFIDLWCDGLDDPWRKLFPESDHRNAWWRIEMFPAVLRKALPSWWWTPAADRWMKRCWSYYPELHAHEVEQFVAAEPPPVPDPERLLQVVRNERERWFENLLWVPPDSELEKSFRYTLQIQPRRFTVAVSTRRRVVGSWTEKEVAHGMTSRFIEFSLTGAKEERDSAQTCPQGRRTVRFSPRLAVEELKSPRLNVGV